MARLWLQRAISDDFLPEILALDNNSNGHQQAEALYLRLRKLWQDRGFNSLPQQQGLMDETRRLLKDKLGAEHWVLDVIRFSKAEYTQINNLKQRRVGQRNEATQQLENPDAIVAVAVRLLEKPDWPSIAAGLAVLTGRRVAEVLSTAQFERKSKWSVVFSGALKRRGEPVDLSFEIPTLTTADRVIQALERLREELPEALSLSARQINQRYEAAVAQVCDLTFADLVPTREGKGSLYTHLFRAVYATIAAFWYCPPSVNETEFKAAIQGHYAIRDEQNPELQRSLAASRHYADYEIADKVIAQFKGRRKGIKLGLGGVQVIEPFKGAMDNARDQEVLPRLGRRQRSSFRIWKQDKERLEQLLEGFEGNQQERFHAFLLSLEHGQFSAPSAEVEEEEAEEDSLGLHQVDEDAAEGEGGAPHADKVDRLIDAISQLVTVQQALIPALSQSLSESRVSEREAPIAKRAEPKVKTDGRKQTRLRSGSAETAARIDAAIDAIMAFNNQPGRKHQDKWAIGISTLKAFVGSQEAIVSAIGGKNRHGESVTGARQEEIQKHHLKHQIDPDKHNYLHRGKDKIDQVIQV